MTPDINTLMSNPLLLGLLQGQGQGNAQPAPSGAGVRPGTPPQGGAPMPQTNPALLGLAGLDPAMLQALLQQG